MERHVLVVLPHPDDESFGCGGIIALHTSAGVPVTYVCGTLGQMGRNMGKPFFANRETMGAVREQELKEAAEALGIQDLRMWRLRDKTLEFEDPKALADRVEAVLHELRPSLVVTHFPGYAVHPDHNALGAATCRAVGQLPVADRPVVYGHAFAANRYDDLGQPDIVVDISSVWEIKQKAIRAHRSQSAAMLARRDAEFAKDPEAKARFRRESSRESFWTYRFAQG